MAFSEGLAPLRFVAEVEQTLLGKILDGGTNFCNILMVSHTPHVLFHECDRFGATFGREIVFLSALAP